MTRSRPTPRQRARTKRVNTVPAWLDALDYAVQGIFHRGHSTNTSSTNRVTAPRRPPPPADATSALVYLRLLEEALRRVPPFKWNQRPARYPPRYVPLSSSATAAAAVDRAKAVERSVPLLVPSAIVSSKNHNRTAHVSNATNSANSNPYAALNDEDDDEYDEEDNDNYDDDHANNHGRQQSLSRDNDTGTVHQDKNSMSVCRILLRVLMNQSEVYDRLAQDCTTQSRNQKRPAWNVGAEYLTQGAMVLNDAVQIVDEQISNWLNLSETQQQLQQHQQQDQQDQEQDLKQDAEECLGVRLSHHKKVLEKFQGKAEAQRTRLEQRLTSQWQSRDAIRSRLGESRWTNNPKPKMDYATKRKEDEMELNKVKTALVTLEELEGRVRRMLDSVREMRVRAKWEREREQDDDGDNGRGMYRYNGVRPSLTLNQRVSWGDYPDPTAFGWMFTGSHEPSRVEFFELFQAGSSEDTLVKLDWYYTTATIKTSLDHPHQGKRQLFGAQVTPDVYVQILQNPRAHTNVRYHTRQSGGRGHGRGRGGRGNGRGGGRGRGGRGKK